MNLSENCEAILSAHDMVDKNDEESIMLYDLNRSTNFDLPYLDYESFNLVRMSDDECILEFRFKLVIEPLFFISISKGSIMTLKHGSMVIVFSNGFLEFFVLPRFERSILFTNVSTCWAVQCTIEI